MYCYINKTQLVASWCSKLIIQRTIFLMSVAFKEALSLLCVFTISFLISLVISPAIDGFSWLTHNDGYCQTWICFKRQLSKAISWLLCYPINRYNLPIELAYGDLDKQAEWRGTKEYFSLGQSAAPQAT